MVACNPKALCATKWPLLGLLNVATLITLCTLFYFNIANFFAGDNDGDRGRWRDAEGNWDPDFRQEEREALKIVLCLIILIVGCVSLIIPVIFVWHPTKGSISKVPVGTLAAILFMFGQMLFISYWYLMDFERQAEEGANRRYLKENNDNNNKNNNNQNQNIQDESYQNVNYNYQEMSEEERLAYYQKVTRNILIVVALLHLVTSVYLYEWGRKLPSSAASLTPEKIGHIGVFMDVWKFASYVSLGIMSLQALRIFIWFFGERGERMREEGLIYNTCMVVMWTVMLTGITFYFGSKAMVKKEWTDPVGVGVLGGCYMGLGLTFFMVFLLYCFASLDDEMEQEMPISVSISACAFFLFTLNIFLGLLTFKYSDSILAHISDTDKEASSDYYIMEKPKPSYTKPAVPVRQLAGISDSKNEASADYYTMEKSSYTQPALPVRKFSDSDYVKDFDEDD